MGGRGNDVEVDGAHGAPATPSSSAPLQLVRSSQATTTVTLVRPPVVVPVDSLAYVTPMPPIGLAYIAGALREAGHTVQVVDAPGSAPDQVTDFMTQFGEVRRIGLQFDEIVAQIAPEATVVGLTHMFLHEWPTVRDLAEAIKVARPDVFVMLGGENATSYRQWILDEGVGVDCCVLGEGEATAVELVGRLAAGASLAGMRGIALRDADREGPDRVGELPIRIRALAEIPRPAWDLFPMDNYFSSHDAIGVEQARSIPMLATRGCPYKCSFCSSPQMWTTRYTVRDAKDIVDELADLVERYGIDNVDFVDLTAITKRKWTLALCDELVERNLGVHWHLPVGTRSEGFDPLLLQRLHDAGCRSVTFAPEHGSQHMLDVYDKRVDLEHIFVSIKDARKVGLVTHVNTVIGHPAETRADRWANLRFLVKVAIAGCDTGSAFIFHPYPGSRDFHEILAAGRLTVDEAYLYDGLANGASGNRSWNPKLSARSLYWWQLAMKGSFELAAMIRDPRRAWTLTRALFAKPVHSQDDSDLANGPVRMRLGEEHDARVIALYLRALGPRGKAGRRSAKAAEAPPVAPERRDPVSAAK